MPDILITGGTGLIGKALTRMLLQRGHQVIILTRDLPKKVPPQGLRYLSWDIKNQRMDLEAIRSADHIVHLAGAGVVDKRWTYAYRKEIVESRTESSRLLVSSLQDIPNNVKSVISSSAIGWYGPDRVPACEFVETDPPDHGFLGDTCRLWEESIEPAAALGKRLVKLRTGIVLSSEGGALLEFQKPLCFGVAAILGSGRQVVSWVHIDDLCRMILHAIENEEVRGAYNAVAPGPVSNKTLTLSLARIRNGKLFIPVRVPSFALKVVMGERSIEVLKSATVGCKKIRSSGFEFRFNTIESALEDLLNPKDRL